MNIFILKDDVSYALELETLCNSWEYKVIGVFDNVNDADIRCKNDCLAMVVGLKYISSEKHKNLIRGNYHKSLGSLSSLYVVTFVNI